MHIGFRFAVTLGVAGALATAACSAEEAEDTTSQSAEEPYLGLEQPAHGLQLRSVGAPIGPGEDVEYCEVAELPGDPGDVYYVNAMEFGNGPQSHHLIVDVAAPGSPAEARLLDMEIGDRVECFASRSVFGEGIEYIGGIQQPYGEVSFPPSVGRVYRGRQRVVFNYHYLNTTDSEVWAKSAVNLHLTDASEIRHIAQIFTFNNLTIDTPPGGAAAFEGECRFDQDVVVSGLVRHTHRWGTDYSVWLAGGPRDGEHLWTSTDWEHDVNFAFDEPVRMEAGQGFRFECAYENTSTHPLRFGPAATDEMCILFGLWWADGDAEPASQDCQISTIGSDGIGRPASEGDFPEPSEEDVAACLAESPGAGACEQCSCDSCGGVIMECARDEDCAAVFACVQETGCDRNSCGESCGSVIAVHSAGVGGLLRLGECVESSCGALCDR